MSDTKTVYIFHETNEGGMYLNVFTFEGTYEYHSLMQAEGFEDLPEIVQQAIKSAASMMKQNEMLPVYIFMQHEGTFPMTALNGMYSDLPDFTKAKGFEDLPEDLQRFIKIVVSLLGRKEDEILKVMGSIRQKLFEAGMLTDQRIPNSMRSLFDSDPLDMDELSNLDMLFQKKDKGSYLAQCTQDFKRRYRFGMSHQGCCPLTGEICKITGCPLHPSYFDNFF